MSRVTDSGVSPRSVLAGIMGSVYHGFCVAADDERSSVLVAGLVWFAGFTRFARVGFPDHVRACLPVTLTDRSGDWLVTGYGVAVAVGPLPDTGFVCAGVGGCRARSLSGASNYPG